MKPDTTPPADEAAKYPRSWMQLFLDLYRHTGRLEQSAKALRINPSSVYFQTEHHVGFAAAFAEIQAELRERLWNAVKHRVVGCDPAHLGRN